MEYSVQLRLDKHLIYVDTVRQYSSCQPPRRQSLRCARRSGSLAPASRTLWLCVGRSNDQRRKTRHPGGSLKLLALPNAICDEAGEVFAIVTEQIVRRIG